MTREETIIAYVDGELAPDDRARFEAEMAADPALGAQVERHAGLARRVGGAYAQVLDEPLPAQLLAVASAANDGGRPRVRALPWIAAAASLVVGVMAGRLGAPASGPFVQQDGVLVARGPVARALSDDLSAQPGMVRVGFSVKAADGRYCRLFESVPDRLAGVACRQDGRWAARTLSAWTPPPPTAYRQAASSLPPALLAEVDALGGEPLDAAAERAARARGWK